MTLKNKNIITYGTFDLLHIGHINLLKRAKALGGCLVVGISTDEFNAMKHKQAFYSFKDRKKILEAIKYVDKVIPEKNWEQKRNDIKKYEIDIFVMGDDWRDKFDDLKDICKVIYLSRTPNVSTTMNKNKLKNENI